jgi:hypothetical protein
MVSSTELLSSIPASITVTAVFSIQLFTTSAELQLPAPVTLLAPGQLAVCYSYSTVQQKFTTMWK